MFMQNKILFHAHPRFHTWSNDIMHIVHSPQDFADSEQTWPIGQVIIIPGVVWGHRCTFLFSAWALVTKYFIITIKIWWKFNFILIQIQIQISLQNFAHAMTALLSWHVPKFEVVSKPRIEPQQHKYSIIFFNDRKIVGEKDPWYPTGGQRGTVQTIICYVNTSPLVPVDIPSQFSFFPPEFPFCLRAAIAAFACLYFLVSIV